MLETREGTPYHYDLFGGGGGDIGHTLILGQTGSGKSFLLNFLLVSAVKYGPRVFILDLGGSYRPLTQLLGGDYLQLSPDPQAPTRVRPFSLPPGERTFQFLAGWVRRLLDLGGYETSGGDTTEIRKLVEDLYRFPLPERRLGSLAGSLLNRMKPAMSRWVGSGTWGAVFDNPPAAGAEDAWGEWQVVDLASAAQHDDLVEAALGYYLEKMRHEIDDPSELGRVKIAVVDEAWKFLRDPTVSAYLAEAAKTWRKKNAALLLATQSGADLSRGGFRQGPAGSDAHAAVPGQPGVPAGPGGNLPADGGGSRPDPRAGPERGDLPAPDRRGRGAAAAGRPALVLAVHELGAGCREAGAGDRGARAVRGPRPARQGGVPKMTRVPTQKVVLAAAWALLAIQVAGGAEARRVRLDSLDEIIEIRAAVRHTTVIALPADELIADFVAGDTEFWQLQGEANIAYLKPQAKGEKTNVALVTRSGNIYSFLCREGGGEPDLVVHVRGRRAPPSPAGARSARPSTSRPSSPLPRSPAMADAAREAIEDASRARAAAERTIEEQVDAFRSAYPGAMKFEYKLDARARRDPFSVVAMWNDGRHTYLRSTAPESPAIYESRDGQPSLVEYELTADGLYVAQRVLRDGWLQIGKQRADWVYLPAKGLL